MIGFWSVSMLLVGFLGWTTRMMYSWRAEKWPKGAMSLPRFQAHRGDWKASSLQENTLSAFRSAKTIGAEMIELDVQMSGDGEIVVFHDFDLKRLGRSSDLVKNLSATDLAKSVGAPLLRDVLTDSLVTEKVNIEIKSSQFGDGKLEAEVARVVRDAKCENRVLFSSFNPFVLGRLAGHLPQVPRALLVSEEDDPGNREWLKKMLLGAYARPHLLHLHHKMITPKRLAAWKKRGIPVVAWTVNESERARELFSWGVVSVISDEVSKLRRELENV